MSDSIAKYVNNIEGVVLEAFRGDTISKIAHRIETRQVSLDGFDYIILHAGTNNVGNSDTFENIISDYGNFVGICRRINPKIKIVISAILPRPVDHEITDPLIRRINNYILKNMSKNLNIRFFRTYRPFMYGGHVKRELFAKRDGGLHLNTEGTNRLRYYFLRSIAAM